MSGIDGYPLTYKIERHDPPLSKAEVRERGMGGCDNLVLVSILGTPGGPGPLSTVVVSAAGSGPLQEDGSWPELDPVQQWQVWSIMADGLAGMLGDDPRAVLCRFVIESVRGAVLGGKVSKEHRDEALRHLGRAAALILGRPIEPLPLERAVDALLGCISPTYDGAPEIVHSDAKAPYQELLKLRGRDP